MNDLTRAMLTSMEVAQMVGKEHSKLLRDIRNYVSQLGEAKIGFTDFFRESTYVTEQNKVMPCFMVTKKGCEFIAHKLTGQKGAEFTARYINRFHEMEHELVTASPSEIPLGELASYLKVIDKAAVRQNTPPHKIMEALKMVSEQFGVRLPEDIVRVPEYEQMTIWDFKKTTDKEPDRAPV